MAGQSKMEGLTIHVNGESRDVAAGTLGELLEELGFAAGQSGIAIAINEEVVPRGRWAETGLSAGDAVDIVGAVQGG